MQNNSAQTTATTNAISFSALWVREWQVKKQSHLQWLYPLVLFLIIVTLFPLALGSEPNLLKQIAVPAVWIACLLSLVMGADNLFKPELENGTLAQLITAKAPIALWVVVRLTIHWLFSAGIVAILSLLATPLFRLEWQQTLILMLTIVVSSPMLLMLTAVASSLTMSLKNAAVLVPLIALPLQLPVLIFAVGAIDLHLAGLNALPIFALLMAGSIFCVIILPWVIAYTLKMAWLS